MKNLTSTTVACYVRISTVGQNEAGQRAELDRWLEGNSLTGAAFYVDKASGDNLARPAFERLQADIAAGKVRCVAVYKLDRLSRSLRDGIVTISDWLTQGVRIVSTSQGFDFSGTIGKLIASLLFGVAEMEQETRRERQAVGIAVAKAAGTYTGRRPGTTKAKPARAAALRKQGLTDAEIAASLNTSRRTVQRYLRLAGQ